jgi:predicted DNA-binding transcriptional regulator YafY
VVRHPAIVHNKPVGQHLSKILKAIATGKVLDIHYTSIEKKEFTNRNVEPIGIYLHGSHWYLVAFCRLRNDYRNFRTDNINNLSITTLPVQQMHPPLHTFLQKITGQRQVHKVVIDVDTSVVKYFGDQKYYNGFVREELLDNRMRMTFLTGSLTGFARWYMMFGDMANIVEPLTLYDTVADIASAILRKAETGVEV